MLNFSARWINDEGLFDLSRRPEVCVFHEFLIAPDRRKARAAHICSLAREFIRARASRGAIN